MKVEGFKCLMTAFLMNRVISMGLCIQAPTLRSFFRFIYLFWVLTRKCLHTLMFKLNIIFLNLSPAAAPLFTICLN